MAEINLTIKDMSAGLRQRLDSTNEPAGSFRVLKNAKITDRGGLAKRDGISVVGDYDSSGNAVTGVYAFEKANGDKLLLKSRGTEHLLLSGTSWTKLDSGLTSGSVQGYVPCLMNEDKKDYLIWGNRTEAMRRWNGAKTTTTAILAGGETSIPVTSTLEDEVFDSKTALSVTTTSISLNTDQTQTTADAAIAFGESDATGKNNKIAQSFVAAAATLKGVYLFKKANTGTWGNGLSVSIQADSAGSPSGTDLYKKSIPYMDYNGYSASEFFVEITATLTPTSTYWIVVSADTASDSAHPNIGTNSAGGYASGSVKRWNTTDGWTAVATVDFYFKTVTASVRWIDSQWVNFYVKITSGAQSGSISKITANTTTGLTFLPITGLSGTPTFEIRRTLFDDSGQIFVNGTEVNYTAITATSFSVTSAPACASGSCVSQKPQSFPNAPYGNRFTSLVDRVYVGNLRSALARDSVGNSIGTSTNRCMAVSKLGDPTNYAFSATRAAGEGDLLSFFYGGGTVSDVKAHENGVYVLTPETVEKVTYSQDSNDLPTRTPLKPGIGCVGKAVKGPDDVYFFTPSGLLTSISRIDGRDTTEQTQDLGFPIRRILEGRVNDESDGLEWRNRIHFCQKADSNSANNDRILVYNKTTRSFEGDWIIPASGFSIWEDKPIAGCSNSANVIKMYEGSSDVWDGVSYPISSEARSNWLNITPSGMEDQSVTGLHVAGYIRGNSAGTYYLYADYSDTPVITVNFSGNESQFTYDINVTGSLGQQPLGAQPLASIDEPDADGYRRFRFSVYFPDIYCNVVSWGWQSSGLDEYIESSQIGLSVSQDPLATTPGLIKSI